MSSHQHELLNDKVIEIPLLPKKTRKQKNEEMVKKCCEWKGDILPSSFKKDKDEKEMGKWLNKVKKGLKLTDDQHQLLSKNPLFKEYFLTHKILPPIVKSNVRVENCLNWKGDKHPNARSKNIEEKTLGWWLVRVKTGRMVMEPEDVDKIMEVECIRRFLETGASNIRIYV